MQPRQVAVGVEARRKLAFRHLPLGEMQNAGLEMRFCGGLIGGRIDEARGADAGRARAVAGMPAPFVEIGVGPGALHEVSARVITVGGAVEQEMRAGGCDMARAKFAEDALPDAPSEAL